MHEPRERLHTPRRLSIVFVLAVAMIGALAVPAFAQSDRDSDGPRVVITGRVAVGAGAHRQCRHLRRARSHRR